MNESFYRFRAVFLDLPISGILTLAKYYSLILYDPLNKGLMQNKKSEFGLELLL